MAESEVELKSLLMKVKEESEKAGLKLSIQKTKIMASDPITLWQKDGETMETWQTIFLGSKLTADGDCNNEIKGDMLLGRKPKINLDSILKSRDITMPIKVLLIKAIVFPVVMHGCELDHEGWALKNCWFWTVALEKTVGSPLDCKEIKPVNPKDIGPKYSLEGLMLKLKLQYFDHLMWRADS